ncbi:alpha-2-glucosyltransferase Alg10 [Lipomyces oligophaga]|uniref:alpha-2-glucosyltransferase Alg10 n=1 Tax=Lipomyces oligophaga TaxID=45792 RepID=UPI0034CD538B
MRSLIIDSFVLEACLSAISAVVAVIVARKVPDPYLDEIFHIPQACRYYNGEYTWDPKITTPPGLYLVSLPIIRLAHWTLGESCTVSVLRAVNLFGVLFAVPASVRLCAATSNRDLPLLIQLFPPLYFFGFLYYTDVWSTVFVLLAMSPALAPTGLLATKVPRYIRIPLTAFLSSAAVLMRQTNVVWICYAAALELLSALVYPAAKGKERANDIYLLNSSRQVEDVSSIADIFRAIVAAFVRTWTRIKPGRSKIRKALVALSSYGFVAVAFSAFVFYNGGIALGDKDNHTAGIHIPQIFYFTVFSCIISAPTTIPIFFSSLQKITSVRGLFTVTLAVPVVLFAIDRTTIAHPFLLADNRHYPFYIWRRIINLTPNSRYWLAPLYIVATWLVFWVRLRSERVLSVILFFGATAAVLVPSPLIECRYFIVPYVVWRLRVAELDSVEEEHSSESQQQGVVMRRVEIAWSALINAVTLALFLLKSFEWPSEPGVRQRFMW